MPQLLSHGLTSHGGLQAGVKSGELASALVGTINVLGTVAAALMVDKFGRKQLLSLSFSGMGSAMLAMSAGNHPEKWPLIRLSSQQHP